MTKVILKKGFIIKTTIGETIPIDADEVEKAERAYLAGKEVMVTFRQGKVRGDLIGVIKQDEDRVAIENFDGRTGKTTAGELKPLSDIFKDLNLLSSGPKPKQLNNP